ncbi:MAG: phosphatase PAP2 family protein [Actinobacteria bacterium]|nr:phosphatase PAP2 family protein [Actinomycetota bacterium]
MKQGLPDWARQRFDPAGRFGLRLTLFALAATLIAIPFSYLLLQVLDSGPLTEVDQGIAEAIHEWIRDSSFLVGASFVLSFLGIPPWLYVTIGSSAYWFYRKGYWRVTLFMVTTPLLGGVISSAIKIFVDRPRPEFDDPITKAFGKSFPSGHAMSSTVGYGTLLLAFMPLIPKEWRSRAVVGYVTLVLLIAASRLGLGVHYLSDVLGGIVLGVAWLSISVATFRIWRREQRKPVPDILEGVEPEVSKIA